MPIDFSAAWKTGIKIINDSISLLPNLILAVVIFVIFLVLAQQVSPSQDASLIVGASAKALHCCSVRLRIQPSLYWVFSSHFRWSHRRSTRATLFARSVLEASQLASHSKTSYRTFSLGFF